MSSPVTIAEFQKVAFCWVACVVAAAGVGYGWGGANVAPENKVDRLDIPKDATTEQIKARTEPWEQQQIVKSTLSYQIPSPWQSTSAYSGAMISASIGILGSLIGTLVWLNER